MDVVPTIADLVYRAMTRKSWVQDQRIMPAAFVLREGENGLSVDIRSPESAVRGFRETFGVAQLTSGEVRASGVEIEVDDAPHALLILGGQDPNRIASQLARIAKLIPQSQIHFEDT